LPEAGPSSPEEEKRHQLGKLLIRAMVAAANWDGHIDEEERGRIIRRMAELDLSQEEKAFLELEMKSPITMERLTAKVDSHQTARQVYVASLLAVDVDTAEEVVYLNRLAQALGMDLDEVEQIQDELGFTKK
jgi:uncharacterized membrane protein YebE (DUF533 family)